jgi:hypothetical protein
MKKEFIIWGIPPEKKYENVLFTKAQSMYEAKKVCKILETEHDCKKLRIQVLDLSKKFNFAKEFLKR